MSVSESVLLAGAQVAVTHVTISLFQVHLCVNGSYVRVLLVLHPVCCSPKHRARVAPSLVGNKLTLTSRLAQTFRSLPISQESVSGLSFLDATRKRPLRDWGSHRATELQASCQAFLNLWFLDLS